MDKNLLRELRGSGFKKEYTSRGGGVTVTEYKKILPDRTLRAQLWSDNQHRLTHANALGTETTTPTEFKDVKGLQRAIKKESERKTTIGTGYSKADRAKELKALRAAEQKMTDEYNRDERGRFARK